MLSTLFSNPLSFIVYLLSLIIAITIHEFAHAYVANRLGDPTPHLQGRVTLNPLAHLDPLGTLMLLIAGFGWGRPVQFDPFNLRHPKRDAAIISLAGPASNIILAILLSLIVRFSLLGLLSQLLTPIIYLNVLLAVFNLVPIHPLDGFKVVGGLLPRQYYHQWMELERYGLIFLIILIFPIFGRSPISAIISPIIGFIMNILLPGSLGGII
ncbi:site-2 protease family protein [Candidatus Gottesmanbacteria bacterium]|nr:site-2 protease family protein [Candidatus Gottesmanbacteria bacterium]